MQTPRHLGHRPGRRWRRRGTRPGWTGDDYVRCADLYERAGVDLRALPESVRGSRLLRRRALSRGELVAVFGHLVDQDAAAARRDAAPVAILYASGGIRRAEASSLQLADLDRTTGRLIVRGKANKQREVGHGDEALHAVEDWLQVRGEEPGALLLPVEKDRRTVRHREPDGSPARLSESSVRLACRRRATRARLRAFSRHDLRRTSIPTCST